MDRPSSKSGEERALRDTVGVEVGKTCYCLIEECVQLLILNMAVHSIYAVLYRSAIHHLAERFETVRLRSDGTDHAEFLDGPLILPPPQELVIDKGLSTTHSHVRLGMIRIEKILNFYRQLR